ncbi:MAG: hypothetical protein H6765_08425 [Candidatus Peribacteria bacterium]|nr:MAG: hypothetical protein H6765_08425 [Candidatus Peribacteria bacterium]
MAGWWLVAIIAIIALWKFAIYLLEFFYDVLNAKRMVFMKVLVPRGDSKADRDMQKELAKDMKEKIARMSQVFRSLHKLGHLTVVDNILRKIFRKPKVTFIIQYERGLLYFLIGTYPEYQDIVEGSISAQFADASIEEIPQPDLFVKKHADIIPMQAVKK